MYYNEKISRIVRSHPYFYYIGGMFLATRIILLITGYLSHTLNHGRSFASLADLMGMWNVWDTYWYLGIAQSGYTTATNSVGMANYAFFPLYPTLIRLVSLVTGDYLLSGLIVSNVCLLIACVYLYKYVAYDTDETTAMRSVKYLFLFPTAFIFSAALTESLFLALALICLYYAKKGNWQVAGIIGFFVALSRPPGVIIALPMAYEYLKRYGVRTPRPDFLLLLLPPIGLSVYAAYNFYLTGDPLAFMHIQATWGGRLTLPPIEVWRRLTIESGWAVAGTIYTIVALALMVICIRKVDFTAWLFGVLLILIPLFTPQSSYSMIRYVAVVFPLFIILGKMSKDRRVDAVLMIVLGATQIIFMAMWTTWSPLII